MKFAGIFNNEEAFEKAVLALKDAKTDIDDIYAPVPVHNAVRNVAGSSRLPALAYILGITSVAATLAFLYYTAVIDWPLIFGGKPSNAFPSFIIITLVLTILSVTILSLLAFSIRAKIYPGKKAVIVHESAMDDKFIIVINSIDEPDANEKLKQYGATDVIQYNAK